MEIIPLSTLIAEIAQQLQPRYGDYALCTQHAWWMLCAITNKNVSELLLAPEISLSLQQRKTLEHWISQQCDTRMPLQYLLGSTPFLDLNLTVEPPLLIPRPETEEWVGNLCEQLKKLSHAPLRIADVGTGTGCIALALARALPHATVVALDINPQALDLAQRNARRHNLSNVEFVLSDLLCTAQRPFDLIVSNPPYISEEEFIKLDPSVALWEDYNALVAPDQGLALIKQLILQAPHYLRAHKELMQHDISNLIIEIGYMQGQSVVDLMQQQEFSDVVIDRDLQGNDRVVRGSVIQCGQYKHNDKRSSP